MRSPTARTVFTIASFLPGIGIVGIAVWASTMLTAQLRYLTPEQLLHTVVGILVGATLVSFVQIGLGIAVALHVTKRPDLSTTERAVWSIACLFLGSIALPLFSLIVLPRANDLPAPNVR
jgi:hypothetical protein